MPTPKSALNIHIPVFLPDMENRAWGEFAGIASITTDGQVSIRLVDEKGAAKLVQLAKDNVLMQVGFDYRMSAAAIKELNERYTKRIVSRVGEFDVTLDGEAVGTAEIKSNGVIEIKTENDDQLYYVDTNKEKE
jgi:hypothetical protein